MGNDESDYGDEYDSQEDYGSELDDLKARREALRKQKEMEEQDDEDEYYDEEEEEESLEGSMEGLRKQKTKKPQLDMLEDLAKQMRDEKDALKAE